MTRANILIVDDEPNILSTLSRALRIEEFHVEVAGSAKIALEKVAKVAFDLLLVDVMMPEMTGIDLLRVLREDGSDVSFVVMSGHGTIETAVEATRLGADDFLTKPIHTDRLLLSIQQCLNLKKLAHENQELRRQAGAEELLGKSDAMVRLREQVGLAASANAPVLITGERGTGKELVARAIHAGSSRAGNALEKLNCAAVPRELIESELFGHEAGAFTGATKQRRGKFERASGGTLFLDEVGDMPSAMQAKLLRVLQEGEIERLGGGELLKVDVRVVAATNKDLPSEIEEGSFRADLYDRLNVVPLPLPPLRARGDDIKGLLDHYLALACETNGRAPKTLQPAALAKLAQYDYPGNVRELKNLMERIVILTPADVITERHVEGLLPSSSGPKGTHYAPGRPLRDMVEDVERDLLSQALKHHDGHMTNTAADLGLERSHLYKKMKALGIR